MRVTLYKYIGDSDTANKLLRDCTVIYNKEVIPYGAFNPNGASFRLDVLHDVNYGKFTYNGHDYYGYVDVSTDSKGIYNYTITTDCISKTPTGQRIFFRKTFNHNSVRPHLS